MLKIKVIEKHRPSNKVLELFNSTKLNYTIINGYTQVIERTNIKQVFPIVYKINNLTIYEIPKEYARKQFYIVNNKTTCDLKDIVPNFYVANDTCHFEEHSPHLHIVGVQLKKITKQAYQNKLVKLLYLLKNH